MIDEHHRIYRLDGIEIVPSQLSLKKEGQEQALRQKPFQVLIYLLERRQRVVTKEELFQHIWPNVAVTDNVVEHCLTEIRKALGDDSRHPRFIKTIPRGGYRFIAAVEETVPDQVSEQSKALTTKVESKAAISHVSSVGAPGKRTAWIGRRPAVILAAAIMAAVFIAGFYVLRGRSAARSSPSSLNVTLPSEAGKRTVAIMFFDNGSSSADIDWLREGLADMIITDLARSKNLAVLSREQLRVLLDRIGHKEADKIRLDEALDVANRSQAKIVVLGSFARLGEQIRIANAYLELGRLDEAIAEYERILKLNPNYPLLHYHLAQTYEQRASRIKRATNTNSFYKFGRMRMPRCLRSFAPGKLCQEASLRAITTSVT